MLFDVPYFVSLERHRRRGSRRLGYPEFRQYQIWEKREQPVRFFNTELDCRGKDRGLAGNKLSNFVGTYRLYAHVLIGWVFFGFILFTIYRELVYYITLRQAFMLSPQYSTRISARTVLITTIPRKYITETALRRVFDNVKRVWINTDTKELEELVEEREKTAMQLEAAEVKLIKLADAARRKGALGNDPPEEDGEVEGESGSVAARWLDRKNRPTHRLKFLIGEKVIWAHGHALSSRRSDTEYIG